MTMPKRSRRFCAGWNLDRSRSGCGHCCSAATHNTGRRCPPPRRHLEALDGARADNEVASPRPAADGSVPSAAGSAVC
jgi:hypothetical protein